MRAARDIYLLFVNFFSFSLQRRKQRLQNEEAGDEKVTYKILDMNEVNK